ncbi:MAG: hypothetical protein IM591_13855 [Chitinophagaceae bacterium]|jgi:hypothetical protein|uniref:hypothetical protein n=1 Tax=Microcystis sp. M061S2 TaxID=2771171 RepID=UPI0025876EE9|nr:hypothetical protein [Microcystis sp. M061S2]MCA2656632.1 hypothetical protein [Microcystis sp. M061S2]MCA6471461.1 hypothetical protein [Chitinophagaceae bacterium]
MSKEQELLAVIKNLKEQVYNLSSKLESYEKDGIEKLFNALQRKANEMADLLNKYKLQDIDIGDKNSKEFERLKAVWTDAKTISESIQILKMSTNKEEPEKEKKEKKSPLTAENIADIYGNKAGQR